MSSHLIDTVIKLAACNRCDGYVFACQVGGVKTAADPTPLTPETLMAALLGGRQVYDLMEQAGRPWKLRARTGASPAPFRPTPAGRAYTVLAGHGCGARGLDATTVEVVEVDPRRTPASKPGPRGSTSTTADAVSRRSDDHVHSRWQPALCTRCRKFFGAGESYVGYYHSSSQWYAQHADGCQPPKAGTVPVAARKTLHPRVDRFGKPIPVKGKRK